MLWILVVVFIHGSSVSIAAVAPPYHSEQDCKDAIEAWATSNVGVGTDAKSAYCVPQPDTVMLKRK